jgi:exopolysaccharide biosynthesis WecB/TagA/CpsF family protein
MNDFLNSNSIDQGKKNLLGVRIDVVNYRGAVDRIVAAAESGQRCTTTALAVHGVMTGVLDAEHRHRLNQLDLVVPDGQPVRWGVNLLYKSKLPDRVYGPNLMLATCQMAAERGLPIYLFGATEEMLDDLEQELTKKFPTLKIAGSQPSKFRQLESEAECNELAEQIKQSGAAICFAGIGCPRQEVWAYEMGDALSMPILAVGAAFAFHAGQLSQAPSWMQKSGLEWLYRLGCEPRRLWQRYLFLNPCYVSLLAMQKMGLKRFDTANTPSPTTRMLYG